MINSVQAPLELKSGRKKFLRIILWFCVIITGIGLGAKLFDLIVLAGDWGASPPESLSLLPYGERFPINPGHFFIPVTVLMIIGYITALAAGWKTPFNYRIWLLLPLIALVIVSISTPLLFWPMINDLFGIANGNLIRSDEEVINLVNRWITFDWMRVLLAFVSFVSYIRAISVPIPEKV